MSRTHIHDIAAAIRVAGTPLCPQIHPIPFAQSALPLDACCLRGSIDPFERSVFELLERGNLPQAELLLRVQLGRHGETARGVNCLGWIAAAAGLSGHACRYFARAAAVLPQAHANLEALQRRANTAAGPPDATTPKFLLIKAWGFGFWSDISHVLSQLLVAELTGRQPVVHWGANSLFWDGSLANAFDAYFEPVSHASLANLSRAGVSIWPPKWNLDNLFDGELHKWRGPYSRVAGIHLLGRPENLLVADFHCSLLELLPWIPSDSPLRPLNIDELYGYLVQKYLRPTAWMQARITQLRAELLGNQDYIAVHARGSDKITEFPHMATAQREYQESIDAFRGKFGIRRIFLMTDDIRLRDLYRAAYGDDVICTECQRTDSVEGVHYQAGRDRRLLGAEVMIDAYLAARANAFIGNGFSNASLQVSYLKSWPGDSIKLIGPRMTHLPNPGLHRW
jgi:protein O-GlcNAc transferase